MMTKKVLLSLTLVLLPAAGAMAASDGAMLAKKCQSCHGVHYDQHALGESPDISKYSAQKLIKELREIRDEKPDDKMAKIMRDQIKDFSDADIEAVAKYIASQTHGMNSSDDEEEEGKMGDMPKKEKEHPCGM
jgi:cytochrome c553